MKSDFAFLQLTLMKVLMEGDLLDTYAGIEIPPMSNFQSC
jgi:hypothetical protein